MELSTDYYAYATVGISPFRNRARIHRPTIRVPFRSDGRTSTEHPHQCAARRMDREARKAQPSLGRLRFLHDAFGEMKDEVLSLEQY